MCHKSNSDVWWDPEPDESDHHGLGDGTVAQIEGPRASHNKRLQTSQEQRVTPDIHEVPGGVSRRGGVKLLR